MSSWYEELNDMELLEERAGLLRELRLAEDHDIQDYLESQVQIITQILDGRST